MIAPPRGSSIDQTLAALADPARRGVVDLLKTGPRRAGDLASALEMSAPAMSRHLRTLRKTGLVEETHDGEDARVRTYRLREAPFRDLSRWLTEVEAFWQDQLAAFKLHAEHTRGKRGKTGKNG